MRRFISGVLIAVLALLAVGDPLLCPDGCTATVATTHDDGSKPTPPDGCVVCQPAISVADHQIAPPTGSVADDRQMFASVLLPAYAPLDQPPRLL